METEIRSRRIGWRAQIHHRRELLAAVEKEMEARNMGISLSPEEQFETFGSDKYTGEYAQEAERRWGDTDAWQESARRTAAYTKDDWIAIKAEADAVVAGLAAEQQAGRPPDAARAMELAEAHRQHISRWFYECSHWFHRRLAEMYVADERFAKSYGDVAPGLAQYVHDAIHANADARTTMR